MSLPWPRPCLNPVPHQLVRITANAGYQAEFHLFFVGLDIEEKARWTEEQIRESLGDQCNKLSLLKFHLNGSSPLDAPNQDSATVDLRIVAQGAKAEMFDFLNPQSFGRKVMDCILESAPVYISLTSRKLAPLTLLFAGRFHQQRCAPTRAETIPGILCNLVASIRNPA